MQVISIVNLKGGVGKTTTAVNMAYELAVHHNRRVLLIDADHQGNASKFYGARASVGSLADLIEGRAACYVDLVQPTNYRNLDVLPSDMSLLSADLSLVAAGGSARRCLSDLRDAIMEDGSYDCMVIDCPPAFTAASVSAIAASTDIIIPIKLDYYAIDGMRELVSQLRQIQTITEVHIAGALITQWRNTDVIQQGETQEQLALILTNSTSRELSYCEKFEQAKQLKELFIKRREEGAELPGRIRDMVAEAMQESASNIARMEAIDKHLIGDWKRSLKKRRISASTAYELSKLDKTAQKKLKEALPDYASPTAKLIKAAGEIVQDYPFAPLVCPELSNSPCTRYKERAAMAAAGTCPGCCHACDHTEGCPALCGVCKKQITGAQRQAELRETKRRADEAYQHSAYRQAQLSILDWAQDPNLNEDNDLPAEVRQTVRSLRSITNLTRQTWIPSLDSLFALADALGITFSELLGLTPELPPCTSEWHKYPVDKPNDGEAVLCRYGSHGNFRVLTYQGREFGEMLDGRFVSLPFEVSDWTRVYPEV